MEKKPLLAILKCMPVIAPLSDFRCLIRCPSSGIHSSLPPFLQGQQSERPEGHKVGNLLDYSWDKGNAIGNGRKHDQPQNTAEYILHQRDQLLHGSSYLQPFKNGDPVFQILCIFKRNQKSRFVCDHIKSPQFQIWSNNADVQRIFEGKIITLKIYELQVISYIDNGKQGTTKPH